MSSNSGNRQTSSTILGGSDPYSKFGINRVCQFLGKKISEKRPNAKIPPGFKKTLAHKMLSLKTRNKYFHRNERADDISILASIQKYRKPATVQVPNSAAASGSGGSGSNAGGEGDFYYDEKENMFRGHPYRGGQMARRSPGPTTPSGTDGNRNNNPFQRLSCVPSLVTTSQTRSALRSVPSFSRNAESPMISGFHHHQSQTLLQHHHSPHSMDTNKTLPMSRSSSAPTALRIYASEPATRRNNNNTMMLDWNETRCVPELTPRPIGPANSNLSNHVMNTWVRSMVLPGANMEPQTPAPNGKYGSCLVQSPWIGRSQDSQDPSFSIKKPENILTTDPVVTKQLGIQELMDIMCGDMPPPHGFLVSEQDEYSSPDPLGVLSNPSVSDRSPLDADFNLDSLTIDLSQASQHSAYF